MERESLKSLLLGLACGLLHLLATNVSPEFWIPLIGVALYFVLASNKTSCASEPPCCPRCGKRNYIVSSKPYRDLRSILAFTKLRYTHRCLEPDCKKVWTVIRKDEDA